MPDAAKRRLVQMLAERDVPLIEDGVYNALHFGATPPYAAKAYDRKSTVMLCSSFTKSLASGFRIGWVAPGRYYDQVRILKFMNTGGTPELLQLAVAEFLENGGYERHLRSVRRAYRQLTEQHGDPAYSRIDAPATPAQKDRLKKLSPDQLKSDTVAGEKIREVLDRAPGNGAPIGGIKVITDSAWFAARPSGTEDVYKIYAESFRGADHLQQVLADAQTVVDAALA